MDLTLSTSLPRWKYRRNNWRTKNTRTEIEQQDWPSFSEQNQVRFRIFKRQQTQTVSSSKFSFSRIFQRFFFHSNSLGITLEWKQHQRGRCLKTLRYFFLQNVILFVTFFQPEEAETSSALFLSKFSLFCPLKHHCAAAADVTLHSWPAKRKRRESSDSAKSKITFFADRK